MFEDVFGDFFNGRRSLEDPRDKITISRENYEKLVKKAQEQEVIAAELNEIKAIKVSKKSECHQLKLRLITCSRMWGKIKH